MNRSTLFHGALALYGASFGANAVLTARGSGLTVATMATALGGVGVFAAGLYGLWHPEQTSKTTDSWLAYLVAVGALFSVVGLVVGQL